MRVAPVRLLLGLLLTPAALPAQQPPLPLIPQPREVAPHGDHPLSGAVQIVCTGCDSEDGFTAADLREALEERRIPLGTGGYRITLSRQASPAGFTPAMHDEGYSLAASATGVTVTAATATGLFYGAQTAKQLFTTDAQHRVSVHTADIRDWPVLRYRGLSDDLSRGPVDSLAYQKQLIRTLASFKANIYSPYFEHTQQYAGNPLPAPPGGSMSAADARELVAYAARYHITIIPDQESFGHLHHTLVSEQYSALAETPHGTVLAPAQPGSLQLIQSMFGELAELYPSPFLHIGADETVDLGHGQTKAAVDSQGLAPVYLDYLQRIDTALSPLHRKLLFWGDIAQNSPELLKTMPAAFKQNTIAVPWWYNPRPQGFAKYIKPFTDAGFETWVAPGINNWSRVYPNWNMAIANIQQFTLDGVKEGAVGQLNTIWYDDGEALAANNAFGIVFGAAQAWQGGQGAPSQFEAAWGPVFHGDATGKINQAQAEIMAAQELLKTDAKVGDASDGLFWIDPFSPDGQTYAAKIRPYTRELRLHAERALTLIAQVRAAYPAGAPGMASLPPPVLSPANQGHVSYLPLTANPYAATSLRGADSLDALELGARRIDFIGLKFQLCDEMPTLYAKAQADAASSDKKQRGQVIYDLSDIRGVNGRLEDLVDSYSLYRDLYADMWLRTNRPYALRPVLEHFDSTINLWYTRIDRLRSVERQWSDSRTLRPAAEIGMPPMPAMPH